MNILWLGYGPLGDVYKHPGRATNELIDKFIDNNNIIYFVEGISFDKNIVKSKKNFFVLKGVCPWNVKNKLKSFSYKITLNNYRRYAAKLIKIIKKHNIKIDGIIVDHIYFLSTAVVLSKILKVKISLRLYGIWDFFEKTKITNITNIRDILKKRKIKKCLKKINKNVVSIIITQDGTKTKKFIDYLRNKLNFKGKIYEIKNCIARSKTLDPHKYFRRVDEEFNVTYISTFSKGKESKLIIQIIELLKTTYPKIFDKLRFFLIGDGNLMKKMVFYSKIKGLSNHIKFTGYLKKYEIERYLNKTDLLICINSYNPALESLSKGIPVIINNFGEVDKLFVNIKGLIIVGNDVRKLRLNNFERKKLAGEFSKSIVNCFEKRSEMDFNFKSDIIKSLFNSFPSLEEKVYIEYSMYIKSFLKN